jgi:hypothetical protein
MSCFFPEESNMMSGALPVSPHPPSPPHTPPFEAQKRHDFTQEETDSTEEEGVNTKAHAIFEKLQENRGGANKVKLHEDKDMVPETHGFLFNFQSSNDQPTQLSTSSPPISPQPLEPNQPAIERSARASPSSFSRPRPQNPAAYRPCTSSALSTLYEASIVSTDTISEVTRSKAAIEDNMETLSITDSVSPSVISASWYRSSKDRLGLGGRLSKCETLPWEKESQTDPGKPKKGRLSVFLKKSI